MQKKKNQQRKAKGREKEKKGKYTLEALESASCLPDDERDQKEDSNANQSKPEKKKQKLPFNPFAFPRDIIPCSVV
jgi:hypothetical protein